VDSAGAGVDLNSDVGEGFGPWRLGDDAAMLDIVTTVNIACGFHAGDPLIMARTVAMAVERGVRVGAHPGYNDLWGYGRRRISGDSPADLATMVVYQVGALSAIAAREGCALSHVKLHGALSNVAAEDPELAAALGAAIRDIDSRLAWLVPAGSEMAAVGQRLGVRTVSEVFADRGYDVSGNLLPRSHPDALVNDAALVAQRAVRVVRDGLVAVGGADVPLRAESICVHGDTRGAVELAGSVRRALEGAGLAVRSFAA
jgi:UPF0271 protein